MFLPISAFPYYLHLLLGKDHAKPAKSSTGVTADYAPGGLCPPGQNPLSGYCSPSAENAPFLECCFPFMLDIPDPNSRHWISAKRTVPPEFPRFSTSIAQSLLVKIPKFYAYPCPIWKVSFYNGENIWKSRCNFNPKNGLPMKVKETKHFWSKTSRWK